MSEDRPVSRRGFLRVATGAAVATGASGVATAQEDGDGGDGSDGGEGTEGGDGGGGTEDGDGGNGGGGGGSETVALVDYAFEPGTDEPLYITPGTTVTFVWETSTHNIVIDSQPDESDWEGVESIEDAGFEHEHTFEVEGDYEFHCQPHVSQGMEGTIVVNQEGAPPQEGGGEPAISDAAKSLGIATSFAMAATLGLAYVFLKYGGGRPAE